MSKPLAAALLAALLVAGGLVAAATPFLGLILKITFEAFWPETISWDAKNAWVKCEGAITGSVSWPAQPGLACAAMHLCANEATLSPEQYAALVAKTRDLPQCGEP